MDHVSRVDAMLNTKKQPISTTIKRMEGKQREDGGCSGGGGSNDRSCYACGAVGHPAWTSPHKEKALAVWREKKPANDTNGSDEKQKERGKQQSFCLTQQAPREDNDAKEPRVEELSDDSDDDSDDSSWGNGNGSDSLRIDSQKLKPLVLCPQRKGLLVITISESVIMIP
jgi:hypothetical protein